MTDKEYRKWAKKLDRHPERINDAPEEKDRSAAWIALLILGALILIGICVYIPYKFIIPVNVCYYLSQLGLPGRVRSWPPHPAGQV